MINFDFWVADTSSKYSVEIYPKDSNSIGCVPLKEGLEYAKKLKIPFIFYSFSDDKKKRTCRELNEIVGVSWEPCG